MLSIIIPVYNESENLPILLKELTMVLTKNTYETEIILVNDGSTDKTMSNVKSQISYVKNIQLLSHRKRFGKGEALSTGLKHAKGNIIVFMDGDLQDDPADIPHLLHEIREGYDLVNGIMTKRKDNVVIKMYSSLANLFMKTFLHSPFTDINCGFKAFKKEVLEEIVLYGNNFRFLPLAVFYKGYKVTEIPVHNRPRIHGVSKYGIGKLFFGIIDTLTTYFLYRFAEKPLHFFGLWGSVFFTAGFLLSFYLAVERIFFGMLLYRRPILQFGILLIIVGLQVIMTGIIGELIVYLHKKK